MNASRASRVENQYACIVGMHGAPSEAREGITEVHFFPFNPVDISVLLPLTLMLMETGTVSAKALQNR